MATIRVKFRPSTVEGKAGTVFYQVIHRRQMARINTDIRLLPCDWRKVCERTDADVGCLTLVRNRIDSDLTVTALIVSDCEESGNAYSAKTIVELFRRETSRQTAFPQPIPRREELSCGVGECMKTIRDVGTLDYATTAFIGSPPLRKSEAASSFMLNRIDELRKERRYSTAENYRHTLNSFSSFVESENIGCVTPSMIMPSLMERYEAWLKSRGLKRNTTSFYMRILRAVYNRAVMLGLVRQSYPFRKVYTGIDTTRKRAVDERAIAVLCKLDLADKPKLQLARDMFIFSFATCGMPFVDMAHLKHCDVKDGYICYERRKTGQPLRVKIVPLVKDIINRYRQEDSPYIFPILPSSPSREGCRVASLYRTALIAYNRHLREISKMLPDGNSLTSYVSRHTWATLARNHGNTAADIGKALGHTSERTTRIYLDSINNTVVDRMNEEILGCLQNISM